MPEPVVFGRYLLLERIAAGGMAEVFKSKSYGVAGFEKLLVIKKILPHLAANDRFVSMFIKEAKIAVNLNHKNVVQVFDLGKVGDDYYIAMEFVHGRDLREITRACAKKRIPLPLSLACYLLAEIAAGLDYAHRRKDLEDRPLNIIHMDISPQNVLVSFEGDVKIADFGIAHAVGGDGKMKGGVLRGKYAYMSPEMATGKPVDQRTDIFSAGVILWELITGRRLFYEPDEVRTIENVRKCKVPMPTEINSQVPAKLEQVAMKALTPDPDNRYQTAEELRAELTEVLFGFTRVVDSGDLARFLRKVFAKEAAPAPGVSDLANLISDLSRLGARPAVPAGPAPVAQGTIPITALANDGGVPPPLVRGREKTNGSGKPLVKPSEEPTIGSISLEMEAVDSKRGAAQPAVAKPVAPVTARPAPTTTNPSAGKPEVTTPSHPAVPASALEFEGDSHAYDKSESVPMANIGAMVPDGGEHTETSAIPLAEDDIVARGQMPSGKEFRGSGGSSVKATTGSTSRGREGFDYTMHAPSGNAEVSISGERKRSALLAVRFFEGGKPSRPGEMRAAELGQILKRYGGTPAAPKGDVLIAYFGVPVAQEDDLERAIACGREVLRYERRAAARLGRERSVGLAVHTGTLAVEGGVPASRIATLGPMAVSGAPLHVVERLARSAHTGQVVASRSVVRAAWRRHEFVRIDADVDKETGMTLERHELVEAAESGPASIAAISDPPLIGRARELSILTGVLAKVQRGQGQVLSLVGEAGSGKSRLLRELSRLVEHKEIGFFSARAVPFGGEEEYGLISDLISSIVGILADDPADVRRDKLMRLHELGLEKHEVHFVGELAGCRFDGSGIEAFDAQARRLGMFAALRKAVERLAKERPLILAFEDLQHADSLSRDALEFLLDAVPERRLLVILTYRTEFKHRWWDRAWYNQVVLKPLNNEDSLSLARACFSLEHVKKQGSGSEVSLAGPDAIRLPKKLGNVILETAGGNPMFIEELCTALVRTAKVTVEPGGLLKLGGDVRRLEVPPTLRATVAARIDRLNSDLKRLLQVASVLGRKFPYRALIDLSGMGERADGALVELQRAGFLVETTESEGDLSYSFRHTMMRDVAYHALPTLSRRKLHRTVAEYLIRNAPEGMLPVEALALHFEQAEDVDRAVEYLEKAGDRQAHEFRESAAITYFRRARDLLAASPEITRPIRGKLADLAYKIGKLAARLGWIREAEEALRASDQLAKEVADHSRRAWALKELGELQLGAGAYERASETLAAALEIVERVGEPLLRFEILESQGNLLAWTGRPEAAERELKKALNEAKKLKDLSLVARILNDLGVLQRRGGAYDAASEYLKRAEEVARRAEDRFLLSRVLDNLGLVAMAGARDEDAETHFREALEMSRAIGDQRGAVSALHNLGTLHARTGDHARARFYFSESDGIAQEIGWKSGELANRVFLAWLRAQDSAKDGRAELEAAVNEAVKQGGREAVARGKYFLGRLLTENGEKKRGRMLLDEARLLAEEIGNRQLVSEIDTL